MYRCDICDDALEPTDPATDVWHPDGDLIACRDCAKSGGVDVGAFCRPVREIAG
jgi:hypothetical protein